jgi:sugar phosphate isomerase/epimerase
MKYHPGKNNNKMNKNATRGVAAAVTAAILTALSSCTGPTGGRLTFTDYPEMKVGFSTQNFMQAMPFAVESLEELITYAAKEGYGFIELRDDRAGLSRQDCERLAAFADSVGIEVIYEININLLHPEFREVFQRGLDHTLLFGEPGILRAPVANSEFAGNPGKVGWTLEELERAAVLAEQCAGLAADTGVTFIVENIVEPFFGNSPEYFGLSDLLKHTKKTGLQFDLCNAFVNGSRMKASPEAVAEFLATMGDRWVTTHVKTCVDGVARPVLGENPLPVKQVTELMGKQGVDYFALELVAVEDKEACFDNHGASIEFLVDQGILEKRQRKGIGR